MADFRLRVTYAETGRLVMLSHLEIARALERAVRRAGLPYAVSQGFSPHMKQAFGSALPVGVGGLEEIFDVSLTDYVPPEEALARLRASSAPDLMPHAARYITKDETAASAAYPRSTYEALLEASRSSDCEMDVLAAAHELSLPSEITVVRKKKERVLVPSEFVVGELEVEPAEPGEEGQSRALVRFTLESKESGSLRPDVLLEHMLADSGLRAASILRTKQSEIPKE